MNRPLSFCLPLGLAACVLAGPAAAAGRSVTLVGNALTVATPCARHVEILADAGLHNEIRVQATADHQEELDRLAIEVTDKVLVHTRPARCWRSYDSGFQPTLSLSVQVPMGIAIAIDESGAGNYTIGPVGGPLDVDLSGEGQLTAADLASLTLNLSGSGNLHVGRIHGPVAVEISGHGDVQIADGEMPKVSVELSGAGAFTVVAGQIGSIKVQDSGMASVKIGAAVGDAQVDLSGVGSVHFASVSGALRKEVSGIGDVQVGR